MKHLLATLGSIVLIGGTPAIAPVQSADRDASGDSSANTDATHDRSRHTSGICTRSLASRPLRDVLSNSTQLSGAATVYCGLQHGLLNG